MCIVCQKKTRANSCAGFANCKSSEMNLLATWSHHCAGFPPGHQQMNRHYRQLPSIKTLWRKKRWLYEHTNTKTLTRILEHEIQRGRHAAREIWAERDVSLTFLSAFDISVGAQALAMWPLTCGAVWGTCQRSEVISVSWTQGRTHSVDLSIFQSCCDFSSTVTLH